MFKHFSIYLIFSVVNAGISLGISVFLARNLSEENYGMIGIFLAVLYFLRPLASFNAIGLVSINKKVLSKNEYQLFSNTFFTFLVFIFLLLLTVSAFFPFFLKFSIVLFFAIVFLVFFMALGDFHNAELIQDNKSKLFGGYTFINRVIIFIVSFLFIRESNLGWKSYIVALLVAELITLFIKYNYSFNSLKKARLNFNKKELKNIFFYGLPLVVALFVGWGLNQSDKFMVSHFFSLKEVAYYTVGYSLGVIINTINMALTNTVVPVIYEALKKNEAEPILQKYTRYYFIGMIFFLIPFALIVYYLVPLAYGNNYKNSVPIVILIAIAFCFNGLYRITGLVIDFYKKNILKTKIFFYAMLINIAISLLLLHFFGFMAPAIGTIVGYVFLAVASQYYGSKIIKEEMLMNY